MPRLANEMKSRMLTQSLRIVRIDRKRQARSSVRGWVDDVPEEGERATPASRYRSPLASAFGRMKRGQARGPARDLLYDDIATFYQAHVPFCPYRRFFTWNSAEQYGSCRDPRLADHSLQSRRASLLRSGDSERAKNHRLYEGACSATQS